MVLFIDDGKLERKVGWQIGSSFVVMRILFWSIAVKELRQKEELLMYWSVYVPGLICDHEEWIERAGILIQVAEMRLLCRAVRLRLVEEDRRVKVEPPPHQKEWAEVVQVFVQDASWTPLGVFCACPTGRVPCGKSISSLAWEHLRLQELERESGFPSWTCYLHEPTTDEQKRMDQCTPETSLMETCSLHFPQSCGFLASPRLQNVTFSFVLMCKSLIGL